MISTPPASSSSRLFRWSVVAALAGFLFGFDTVVISGAEKTIQNLWGLSPFMHGLAMSAALWGTVLGSMLGGWPTDRYGRRKTLLWIGVPASAPSMLFTAALIAFHLGLLVPWTLGLVPGPSIVKLAASCK